MLTLIVFGAKYLIVAGIIAFGFFFFKNSPEIRKKIMLFSVFSLPLSYLLGLLARHLWLNPRPFVVNDLEPLIHHAADNGFPSDHTLLLATLAAIAYFFNKKYSFVLWAITLVVGFSRILAQVHHFADILGSIIIALIATGLVYFVLERQKKL